MPEKSKKNLRQTRQATSIFSLLRTIITRIKQTSFRKEKAVLSQSDYNFGCSPGAAKNIMAYSENGDFDISGGSELT
jgi:hypothetical protein